MFNWIAVLLGRVSARAGFLRNRNSAAALPAGWMPWIGPASIIGIVTHGQSPWPWASSPYYPIARAAEGRSLAEFTTEVPELVRQSH